jgi:hypothetical protein
MSPFLFLEFVYVLYQGKYCPRLTSPLCLPPSILEASRFVDQDVDKKKTAAIRAVSRT